MDVDARIADQFPDGDFWHDVGKGRGHVVGRAGDDEVAEDLRHAPEGRVLRRDLQVGYAGRDGLVEGGAEERLGEVGAEKRGQLVDLVESLEEGGAGRGPDALQVGGGEGSGVDAVILEEKAWRVRQRCSLVTGFGFGDLPSIWSWSTIIGTRWNLPCLKRLLGRSGTTLPSTNGPK